MVPFIYIGEEKNDWNKKQNTYHKKKNPKNPYFATKTRNGF
jgi:hypothetical protein